MVLITDRHRVVGNLLLPREGYLSRFSDFINRTELRFIPLTDAVVAERDNAGPAGTSEHEFIAIGSDHVELAFPDNPD